MTRHILIVAGDPSADRHGAALVRELKLRDASLRVSALGGEHLKSVVDQFLYPLVGVGGFGFWEPLLKLPQLLTARATVRRLLQTDPPQLVIPIDFYGFNIHVARMAHSLNVPVVYYISPQIWASRPGRIKKLRAVVKQMLVVLPFEVPIYEAAGLPVRFVGHPLVDTLPPPSAPGPRLVLGLLPGSRRSVAQRHLPILVEAARVLQLQFPTLDIVLFRPREIGPDFYAGAIAALPIMRLVSDESFTERRALSVAICVSGTSALENMLLGIPMVIMYRLSRLTYAIAKYLIRVPFIGMPNLLAGRAVVPEFVQDAATPARLAEAAGRFLSSENLRAETRELLLGLRTSIGHGGSGAAAEEVLKHLNPSIATTPVPLKAAL